MGLPAGRRGGDRGRGRGRGRGGDRGSCKMESSDGHWGEEGEMLLLVETRSLVRWLLLLLLRGRRITGDKHVKVRKHDVRGEVRQRR